MTPEMIDQYYTNLLKFQRDEWSLDQWSDYCTMILGVLMEEHKDVFIRLKDR